jgi:cytochrome c-type biogenesis protein
MVKNRMFENFPYLAAFFGGILSFLSPCVLPLVPAYLSYMAGIKFEDLQQTRSMPKILQTAILFVLGFSTVFISLGAAASSISGLLREYQYILAEISAILIILMGIHVSGLFRFTILYRDIRFDAGKREKLGFFAPYIMGLAFGFGWTPCIGPILAGILALAANAESFAKGVTLLVLYAAGLGIPFILSAIGISRFVQFSQKVRKNIRIIEITGGILLIITGVLLLTGTLQSLGFSLIETFPILQIFLI